jgi:hypothetical protein
MVFGMEESTVPIPEERVRSLTRTQEIKHPVEAHVLGKSEVNEQPH